MSENSMLRVPLSVNEFQPPKPTDLITEAANLHRAHTHELGPLLQAISGEAPSIHGSLALDIAECAFTLKKISDANGYTGLATLTTAELWQKFRPAFKRNTKIPMRALEQQNKRLRLEHITE